MTIRMPAMVPAQETGWTVLIEIASLMPAGCTLVGGQMVHFHCIERGQAPMRATIDLDAILDVRARPYVRHDVTEVLTDLGFSSAGSRRGDTSTVGEVAGRLGAVPRPNLLGALVAKAATTAIAVDPGRSRHVSDFAVLASLLRVADLQGQDLAPRDIRHLRAMIPRVTEEGVDVQGAERGIAMLNAAIRRAERQRLHARADAWLPARPQSALSPQQARNDGETMRSDRAHLRRSAVHSTL